HSLGQFSIAPVLDFERDASMDTPYSYKGKTAMRPEVDVDQSFNPFSKEIRSTPGQGFKKHKQADWESLYVGLESKSNQSDGESSHFEVESDPDSVGMFGQEHTIAHFKTFQVQNKYIIKPIKSGLVIINQHRAHQRILYESFLEEITVNAGVSQQLMFPKQLHYSRPETAVIRDLRPQLEQAGFVFECLDDEAIEINGIPSAMAEEKVSDILDSLIRDVQQQVPGASFSQSDLIAKSLAKSMAIKSGKHLGSEEREFLIDKLFFCKEPDKSPFSKPVFVTLRAEDLEKFFI
ncbi:MAG: DNA mismatch repair protein MutL, partial [Bacteroidia bacterium]|nr:DNA mismatch repair protein MutL [Bacteroidia bacterium]